MRKYSAIALIEFSSIPIGMRTGDQMLKHAPVSVLRSGTVHNGKYLFLVGGSVAAVTDAFEKGRTAGADVIMDSVFLADVHPQLHDAILGRRRACEFEALGIVETATVAAAIAGTDLALKSATVDLIEFRAADDLGGKCLIILNGKVEDVQTSIQALKQIASEHHAWLQDAVIPRIDADLQSQIEHSTRFSSAELMDLSTGEI